jgi:hypothetical protein
MEKFKGSKEQAKEPDWHNEIDWNTADRERQIALFYSKTCDELKDREGFKRVFSDLTLEFMKTHPGPEGDKIYAEWMITRMRSAFPLGE